MIFFGKSEHVKIVFKSLLIIFLCFLINFLSVKVTFLKKIKNYNLNYGKGNKERVIYFYGEKIHYPGYIKINGDSLSKQIVDKFKIKKGYFLLNKNLNNFVIGNRFNVDILISETKIKKIKYERRRRY